MICNRRLVSIIVPFLWRCFTLSDYIYILQECRIFHVSWYIKLSSNLLEFVIIASSLYHHISTQKTTRIIKHLVSEVISCTNRKRRNIWLVTNNSFKFKEFWLCTKTIAILIDSPWIISTTNPLVFNMNWSFKKNHHKFKIVNDLLYFEDYLIYIWEGSIHLLVLQAHYDFPIAKKFNFNNILQIFLRLLMFLSVEDW